MLQGLDFTENIRSALFGIAIGDALGVSVEFKSRENLKDITRFIKQH